MKKLEFINLADEMLGQEDFENLCMTDEEIEAYKEWTRDAFWLFEGDSDYMIDECWNITYFMIIKNKVYYIDLENDAETLKKLEEFCKGQDPTVSRWWYNTRTQTKNRKYFEENTRGDFEKYKWLKIAYRWWCWYVYTCFMYV